MNTMDEQTVERVAAAVSEALGEALDCTRVWSAWGYGTMGENDFVQVADDAERVDEITRAAISAMPDTNTLSDRIAELEEQVSKARENALREAADVVHQECWTEGPMSETLMAEQETTTLAIRAIQSLIDKEPKT